MGAPAGIDLTWLATFIRSQITQVPLPPQGQLTAGTITARSGLHIDGSDIQLSPAALAALKKLLGL